QRWLRPLLVVGLLLATLVAADPVPVPVPQVRVPARLGALTATDTERLYVIDPGPAPGVTDSTVAAYRLPAGAPLWRIRLPMRGQVGSAVVVGGTLVLAGAWVSALPPEAVGLDVRTGAVSWRGTVRFVQATADDNLLLWEEWDRSAPGQAGPERPDPPVTVRSVDARSGRARWSVSLPEGTRRAYRYVGDRVASVVVGTAAGRIEVLDVRTGRVVGTLDLPATGPEPDRAGFFDVVDDLLVVHDGARSVTAYGLDDLRRRWSSSADARWGSPLPVPCGPVLCRFGHSGGIRALDPATGRVRWSDPRWAVASPVDGYLVASGPYPLGSGSLVVLDPADGRVRGELGRWDLAGPLGGHGPLIGVRADPAARRALIAELDPVTVEVRVLGTLPDASSSCEARTGLVVCRRLDGAIGVWRLPA
ncbi:MAG TPA: PQQ-binding-like beta-propeller repeat protein, partial [Micromonospora sp.]